MTIRNMPSVRELQVPEASEKDHISQHATRVLEVLSLPTERSCAEWTCPSISLSPSLFPLLDALPQSGVP